MFKVDADGCSDANADASRFKYLSISQWILRKWKRQKRRPRAFSANGPEPQSWRLQPPVAPRGGLTPAEAPLIDAEILFRQPGPAHPPLAPPLALPADLASSGRSCASPVAISTMDLASWLESLRRLGWLVIPAFRLDI
jgi:hypothetical protein